MSVCLGCYDKIPQMRYHINNRNPRWSGVCTLTGRQIWKLFPCRNLPLCLQNWSGNRWGPTVCQESPGSRQARFLGRGQSRLDTGSEWLSTSFCLYHCLMSSFCCPSCLELPLDLGGGHSSSKLSLDYISSLLAFNANLLISIVCSSSCLIC